MKVVGYGLLLAMLLFFGGLVMLAFWLVLGAMSS